MATATASPTDHPTILHHKNTGCDGDDPVDDLHHDGISRGNMNFNNNFNNNNNYNNNIHEQDDKATKNSGKIMNHLYGQTGHCTDKDSVKGEEVVHDERNIEQKKGAQSVNEQQIEGTDQQQQQQDGNGTTVNTSDTTVKRGRGRPPKSPTTRGRPRRDSKAVELMDDKELPKKKRGRPKKIMLSSEASSDSHCAADNTVDTVDNVSNHHGNGSGLTVQIPEPETMAMRATVVVSSEAAATAKPSHRDGGEQSVVDDDESDLDSDIWIRNSAISYVPIDIPLESPTTDRIRCMRSGLTSPVSTDKPDNTSAADEQQQQQQQVQPKKRGRGRPPKPKTEKKVKRPVGRPRIHPKEEVTVKRKRGRPRKNSTANDTSVSVSIVGSSVAAGGPSIEKDAFVETTVGKCQADGGSNNPVDVTHEEKPKRKRGRPRKNTIPQEGATASAQNKPKRPRGRPRKHPLPAKEEQPPPVNGTLNTDGSDNSSQADNGGNKKEDATESKS